MCTIKTPLPDKVKIELSGGLLAQLVKSGIIFGNDCKCLDANAKHVLWHALLNNSANEKPINDN